jgi:fermentation-respiration switch protein FrsA (DUF1100 family)
VLKTLAISLVLGYALLAGLVWWFQEQMLFFPQATFGEPVAPPGWKLEEVKIRARDGTSLAGVLMLPAPGEGAQAAAPLPLVMFFGGNAEEATANVPSARSYGERALLLVNYRGYGASAGKPGEAAMVSDAVELHDWAVTRPEIDRKRIAVHGRSLGSGVAVALAAARPVKCVVLTSPFDSVRSVAQAHYPWLPVSLLLRHPFDSAALAPGLKQPALVLVAREDRVIAPRFSERLAGLWGGPLQNVVLDGRGHNDFEMDPRYFPAIANFLDQHL